MPNEAISDVSIASSALIKLGQEPITDLSADQKSSRLCNARFAMIRNSVLESYEWGVATKTIELAAVSDVVIDFDWAYAFDLPADYMKMQRGEDLFDDYEVFSGNLYADVNPFKIKYTWKNTNSGSYTYCLAECIAWRLAADLAYSLTNSQPTAEAMLKGYELELKNARYSDSHKKTPQPLVAEDFIRSRF